MMLPVSAVAGSFVLMLMGTISLAALELLPPWAVPLSVGGSGALLVAALHLRGLISSRARE